MRPVLALLALLVVASTVVSAAPQAMRVLTYNVGNANSDEPNYPLRLSYQSYEDHVGARIRALDADVVALQEVLSEKTCLAFTETDPARTCYAWGLRPEAAARVLGPGYSVACDARDHVECVGVKTSFGTIRGLAPGSYARSGAETPPLPFEACTWAEGECHEFNCDAESTVSAVWVDTAAGPIRVVHLHPTAAGLEGTYPGFAGTPFAGNMPYSAQFCRAEQLKQAFEELATGEKNLLLGDVNFDEREPFPMDQAIWREWVGPYAAFEDHTPRDELYQPYGTHGPTGFNLDHVLTDFAESADCETWGGVRLFALGEVGERLDAGFDWSQLPGGEDSIDRLDHRAISCEIS